MLLKSTHLSLLARSNAESINSWQCSSWFDFASIKPIALPVEAFQLRLLIS